MKFAPKKMKAHKMTRIKLEIPKLQNIITKNPQSSQEESQIPLLLLCEAPHKKIEDPKMIRRKLKTPKLHNTKIKNPQSSQEERKIPFHPLCETLHIKHLKTHKMTIFFFENYETSKC